MVNNLEIGHSYSAKHNVCGTISQYEYIIVVRDVVPFEERRDDSYEHRWQNLKGFRDYCKQTDCFVYVDIYRSGQKIGATALARTRSMGWISITQPNYLIIEPLIIEYSGVYF